ncbi:hypothetical protein EW145_g7327 [Phellinidium pouzarii]|uniref:Uncharacterized protein n=1 Tax=Phellinidium pouzarii TaxID=167371 RepID=A0A4S4KLH1_9AGAM|nr:hypothetical protein EW145_g7327 [Phellinidium pouzarii]
MHTQHNGGINQDLVSELEQNFTVQPVLTSSFSSDSLEDITPEDISMAELDEAFDSVAAAPTDFREGVDTMTVVKAVEELRKTGQKVIRGEEWAEEQGLVLY